MAIKIEQTSFGGGVVSRANQQNLSSDAYATSASKMENFVCNYDGSIRSRQGFRFCTPVNDHEQRCKLQAFQFSHDQNYALAFMDYRALVIKDGTPVLAALNAADPDNFGGMWFPNLDGSKYIIKQGSVDPEIPKVSFLYLDFKYAGYDEFHGFLPKGELGNLQEMQWAWGDDNELGFETLYVKLHTLVNVDDVSASWFKTYIGFSVPYSASEAFELDFAQSGDVIYTVHKNYVPHKISRYDEQTWDCLAMDVSKGPWAGFDLSLSNAVITLENQVGSTDAVSTIDIFDNPGAHLRLGFYDHEDPVAIAWSSYTIESVTDAKHAVLLQNEPLKIYNKNPDFKLKLAYWYIDATYSVRHRVYLGVDSLSMISSNATPGVTDAWVYHRIDNVMGNTLAFTIRVARIDGGTLHVRVGSAEKGSQYADFAITAAGEYEDIACYVKSSTIWFSLYYIGGSTQTECIVTYAGIAQRPLETLEIRRHAWSDGNFPSSVCFHNQRLIFSGVEGQPQKIWRSRTGDYENFNFDTPILADSLIEFQLDSKEIGKVIGLIPYRDLYVFCNDSEWIISGDFDRSDRQSTFGCADIKPIVVGNSVIAISQGGRSVVAILYSNEHGGLMGHDLTRHIGHVLKSTRVIDICYITKPQQLLFCLLEDGGLLCATYDTQANKLAWTTWRTEGTIESILALTGSLADKMYISVSRTINGMTYRSIEYVSFDERVTDGIYVDSSHTYQGVPISTLTGLYHLIGRDITLLLDGGEYEGTVDQNGSIELPFDAAEVHIGLPYCAKFISLDIDIMIPNIGRLKWLNKALVRIVVDVLESFEFKVSIEGDNSSLFTDLSQDLVFRTQADEDGPPVAKSGQFDIDLPGIYEGNSRIVLEGCSPLPVSILSYMVEVELEDLDG